MNLKTLISKIKKRKRNSNIALIKKAYMFAESAHSGQKRASNEPYIKHLLHVASILNDLGMDDETIIAGLLHDTLEDTKTTYKELEKEFGTTIASLVDGVTKISELKFNDNLERDVESLRKVLLATSKDFRVIIIKLADRLHNMRTLSFLPLKDQKRIAKDTLEIYAPLAYRLGITPLKVELEDLAFKHLYPEEYKRILDGIISTKKEREKVLLESKNQLENELKNHNVNALIQYRLKNIYSVYKKIYERNYELESIRDLIALRVITKSVKECYEVLGIVHKIWKPMHDGIRDYIALPKANMYQSIHTNVITNNGLILEVQIRSEDMHKLAEAGIAAHWKYKGIDSDEKFDKKLQWLKEIVSNDEYQNAEMLKKLKLEIFGDEIFVFTPKGKIIELPIGSTPVDFAYQLHSDIGDHCIGAKINGTFVPLNHELKNGEIVEIITQKNHKPSRDWLKFAKTSKARDKIRHFIRIREKIPVQSLGKKYDKITIYKSILEIKDMKNAMIKFSHCCNPLPNDKVIAVISKNNNATIHKKDCELIKNSKNRVLQANWIENFDTFIEIRILAEDRLGLFADLLKTFSNSGINLEKANAKIVNKTMAECNFKLKINSLEELSRLIKNLSGVVSVKKVSIA